MDTFTILKTIPSKDYELLDSGEGEKLERYGKYVLARPDPQALWAKKLSIEEWKKADAVFSKGPSNSSGQVTGGKSGKWILKDGTPKDWKIEMEGLTFKIMPTPFKHTGIFPEQVPNWKWMREIIEKENNSEATLRIPQGREINVLNLFGYTGGATLACAMAGAKVTHVDSSKAAITWANENAEASGLKEAPIRWILDDAFLFVKKELKRGKRYDGILMDPPAFGHGAKGEIWKIEEKFLELVEESKKLLSKDPIFFLVNGYSSGYSAVSYFNNIIDLADTFGGKIETGELTIEGKDGRLLPSGIFSRWQNKK